jgi:OOP family OmpA-OmpF porin
VKSYMVGKGIAAERLTAVGYGMDKPLTANKTAADKAKNRRTEFTLQQGKQ